VASEEDFSAARLAEELNPILLQQAYVLKLRGRAKEGEVLVKEVVRTK